MSNSLFKSMVLSFVLFVGISLLGFSSCDAASWRYAGGDSYVKCEFDTESVCIHKDLNGTGVNTLCYIERYVDYASHQIVVQEVEVDGFGHKMIHSHLTTDMDGKHAVMRDFSGEMHTICSNSMDEQLLRKVLLYAAAHHILLKRAGRPTVLTVG